MGKSSSEFTTETNAAKSWEFARKVIDSLDTNGRPEVYALAEDYLMLRRLVARLGRTLDALLPANGCTTVKEALEAFGNGPDA